MKTTTFRGHAATFARLLRLKSRVSCFRRRRRRRRWRARSRRHRRTRHSKHIFFSRCCVIQNFLCCCDKNLFSSHPKRSKKTKQKQKNERSKHMTKRGFAKKSTKKARPERPPHNKDLKVFISSEEGREGYLISSLSVLVVISNDAHPVCNRKEEKAEERKRRRC